LHFSLWTKSSICFCLRANCVSSSVNHLFPSFALFFFFLLLAILGALYIRTLIPYLWYVLQIFLVPLWLFAICLLYPIKQMQLLLLAAHALLLVKSNGLSVSPLPSPSTWHHWPILFFFVLVVVMVLGVKLRASQVLHQLFCVGYFQDRVSQTICPCWLQTSILLMVSVSQVVRIRGKSHQYPATQASFLFFFIHMCIQCLGHFSPRPHALPTTNPTPSFSPPHPLDTRQKLFCPYL
jgi:hypothetical protein